MHVTWQYTCVCICKNSRMSSGDDNDLDCILGAPVSDELVAMTESPQQPDCSQNLLGIILAPTNDTGSTAELPPRKGRTGELWGEGPCKGPCLAHVLPWPHPCIIRHVKNAGILFTPTKMKHWHCFSQNTEISHHKNQLLVINKHSE